ncbi:MAG: methyltransferase domain-containing protein [Patescibacteria group bacterium]
MIPTIDDDFNKEQYEQHIQDYIDLNKDGHVGGGTAQDRISMMKQFLAPKSHILEIGSGGGDDALALQEAGYEVTASDYSEKFVQVLKSNGLDAILFNAKTDKIDNSVDAIYANAVFVHFTHDEFKGFLQRASSSLTGAKIIYLSVIKGDGAERRGPSTAGSAMVRDFQYYTDDDLRKILTDCGYNILDLSLRDDKWIQVVAQLQ